MTEIIISSLDKIADAAQEFVSQIGEKRVFAFYGGMGAGKTTFIKAVCDQLGVNDAVTSPTFAIVNEYNSQMGPIYHFDFYRIKRASEVLDIGFDDYIYSGNLCLMEWPELIEDFLPEETTIVKIMEIENGMRKIIIE
ncbi:MAG: tRNA (adenosine(37)-N6)-threonylcarbamoyltransferase complex ATPase subunit type 1 TsaE [Bacteroidaceae bacterium]|jgi:tRNA threonylcarbamoyladenosine biosynthesis protein TsaE|nr:tRNA (adenosine(37)-N6)-threonylcarbamoyltransferase complex ATPase subunit type 1 TsaE [Bacteroidaceae bacterium]